MWISQFPGWLILWGRWSRANSPPLPASRSDDPKKDDRSACELLLPSCRQLSSDSLPTPDCPMCCDRRLRGLIQADFSEAERSLCSSTLSSHYQLPGPTAVRWFPPGEKRCHSIVPKILD